MKKFLLTFGIACCGLTAVQSNAQTITSQNFEGVTVPALPAGWMQGGSTAAGCPGWKTGTGAIVDWGTVTGTTGCPAHTQYAIIDQYNDTTTTTHSEYVHDTLSSPVFSMGSYSVSNVWLNYDYFFYNAQWTSTGQIEQCYILGSTNGGTTWSIIDSLGGNGWGGAWSTGHTCLSTLSGTNCKIAFAYTNGYTTSTVAHLLGCALDNISVVNLTATAAAVTSVVYNSNVNGIATNGTPVSFTVQNNGVTITSLNMQYQVDGNTPVTQNFTGLSIAAYTTSSVTAFTTPMSGAVAGANHITVTALQVNGAANSDPADSMVSNFALATRNTPRSVLVEEFTSSTCPPCASFAASFDPFCTGLGFDNGTSGLNIIKYQMNWPDWSNDASYNNDGLDRRTYYNCNGIPKHFIDGQVDNNGFSSSVYTAEFNAEKADSSFMTMAAFYYVDTVHHKVSVRASVTPLFTKTGAYHMYVAVCDKHYKNYDNEWSMVDYYNVMRQMLPNGNGTAITSFTSGTAIPYTDTLVAYTFVNSNSATSLSDTAGKMPHMNSNTFWNNPGTNSELLAWVEEDATQSVMQSAICATPILTGLSVTTPSYITGINLFPNPSKNETNLNFNLEVASKVAIKIITIDGKFVSEVSNTEMGLGSHNVVINTNNLAAGNYVIVMETNSGIDAQYLSVRK